MCASIFCQSPLRAALPALFSCLGGLLAGQTAQGQARLPILRATQPKLSIREGASLYRDVWGVYSVTRPDVFVAQPFKRHQRLVFYSDQDSVVFWVKPRRSYDFVVLVGGRDSAFTRISTAQGAPPTLVPKLVYTRRAPRATGPDTIRFTLDQRFGIHVPGQVNGSAPIDFLFDTGAGAVVLTAALVRQRVPLRQDGHTGNVGADGQRTVATSAGNTLQVAGLRWPNVSLLTIDYPAGSTFEGVLGWVAFEQKVVELDYEHGYLVLHDRLPALAAAYAPVPLQLRNGIPFVAAMLEANGQRNEGWFDLDTGSDGGLVIGQRFAASHGLPGNLRRLGTASAGGSTGGTVRQTVVALPTLTLGAYSLPPVPLYINDQDPVGGAVAENIGSDLLRRFTWLLDFAAGRAYLKPNPYFAAPLAPQPQK